MYRSRRFHRGFISPDRRDLPLAAISRSIEIDLREALGETDLPADQASFAL
jgi:hypothetical protein